MPATARHSLRTTAGACPEALVGRATPRRGLLRIVGMASELLLRVKESYALTGLGMLLLPTGPVAALAQLDLHTVWAVELVSPLGHCETAMASVEEITRHGELFADAATQERGLLLTHEGATPVPAGTQVFLAADPKT
jgi:hypothetical protein